MKYNFKIGLLLVNLCTGFITNPFSNTNSIRSITSVYADNSNNDLPEKDIILFVEQNTLLKSGEITNNNELQKKEYHYFYAKEYYEFLLEFNIIKKKNLLLSSGNDYISYAKNREKNYRIFENNLIKINKHNDNNQNCKLSINQFTDEIDFFDSNQEMSDKYQEEKNSISPYFYDVNKDLSDKHKENKHIINQDFYAVSKILKNPIEYLKLYSNLPPKKIWGKKILSDVKNQGRCGSCWAFSTTSSIESLMRINNYTIERLSEQQLVDCSKENNGCNGGLMHQAYDYIIKNKGLLSNEDYEYVAQDQICKIKVDGENSCDCKDSLSVNNTNSTNTCECKNIEKNIDGSDIKNYEFIIPKSKIDIMASLQNSPIAIALDANSFVFRFYKEGVIDIPINKNSNINHAVLLTGYDTDINGTYWIIQNSWGEKWGDNGFAKIRATDGEGVLLSQIYGVYPKY